MRWEREGGNFRAARACCFQSSVSRNCRFVRQLLGLSANTLTHPITTFYYIVQFHWICPSIRDVDSHHSVSHGSRVNLVQRPPPALPRCGRVIPWLTKDVPNHIQYQVRSPRLKGLEPIIWAVLGLPAKARRWYLFQCTVVGRQGFEPWTLGLKVRCSDQTELPAREGEDGVERLPVAGL